MTPREGRTAPTSSTFPTITPPPKPDGYDKRLVEAAQTDEDREYEVLFNASLPEKRKLHLDLAVAENRRRLQNSEEAQAAFYERNGYTLTDTPAADPEAIEALEARLITAEAFLKLDLPEPQWFVPGLIPQGALGVLVAAQKTGKSLMQIDCGNAICSMAMFLNRPTTGTNVLIIEGEGTPNALQNRIKRITDGNAPDNMYFLHREDFQLDNPSHLAALEAMITTHNIGLVFMGPLSQIGNIEEENNAAPFNKIAKALNKIITRTGTTIILVHHRVKAGQTDTYHSVDTFFNTSRGSSSLMGAVDFALGLQRSQESPYGTLFNLQRDGPPSIEYYKLDFDTLRMASSDKKPTATTTNGQTVLNALIASPGAISMTELRSATNLSADQITNAMQPYRDDGTITLTGSGRNSRYDLDPAYRERMERDPKADNGIADIAETVALIRGEPGEAA